MKGEHAENTEEGYKRGMGGQEVGQERRCRIAVLIRVIRLSPVFA